MSQVSAVAGRAPWRWFSVARFLILAQTLANVVATLWNLPGNYRNFLSLEPNLGFNGWSKAQIKVNLK